MREPLGWPDVEVRPTPYRDADGEIDIDAYTWSPRALPTIIAALLAWGLVGLVVWGVFLVTP